MYSTRLGCVYRFVPYVYLCTLWFVVVYSTFISQTFERKHCLSNGTLRMGIVVRRKLLCHGSGYSVVPSAGDEIPAHPSKAGSCCRQSECSGFSPQIADG